MKTDKHDFEELKNILEDETYEIAGGGREFAKSEPIHKAGKDSISFCKWRGEKALDSIRESDAGIILCRKIPDLERGESTLIKVENPKLEFIRVLREFFSPQIQAGIDDSAKVHPEADIHSSAYIGPYVKIGKDCEVGKDTVIRSNVQVMSGTRIGDSVHIDAGTVIGSEAYSHASDGKEFERFPSLGGVLIEDNVEIGANSCIDKGTLEDTIIREGAKIDNLTHIAHDVEIGENTKVVSDVQIAGVVEIGENAHIAPSSTIKNGLKIGDNATVGLGAVVLDDVIEGETVVGNPAREIREFGRLMNEIRKITKTGDKDS